MPVSAAMARAKKTAQEAKQAALERMTSPKTAADGAAAGLAGAGRKDVLSVRANDGAKAWAPSLPVQTFQRADPAPEISIARPQAGTIAEKAAQLITGMNARVSGAAQPTGAYRALTAQPENQKWYAGDKPTNSETLARMYTKANGDENEWNRLYEKYKIETQNPASPIYAPYAAATNQTAISELSALGVDVSGGITDDFLNQNAWLKGHYRVGVGGTPLSPAKGATAEQDAAYWFSKILGAEDDTKQAEKEWAAMEEEIAYWTNYAGRDYSDEEILKKINWKKYPKLAEMDEKAALGTPLSLNRAVGYSKDNMLGAIWAARSGQEGGGSVSNAVKYRLNAGDQKREADPLKRAWRDPASGAYNPYALGSTLDEAGLYFGQYEFTREWAEANRAAILASGDKTAIGHFQDVLKGLDDADEAENQFSALQARLGELMATAGADLTPEEALADALSGENWKGWSDEDEYGDLSMLTKIDDSLKSGATLSFARALNYSRASVLSTLTQKKMELDAALKADAYVAELDAAMGAPAGGQISNVVPLSGESAAAVNRAKDKNIAAAAGAVKSAGTNAEKLAFETAYSSDFPVYIDQIQKSIEAGGIDAETGFSVTMERTNAYALNNYIEYAKTVRAFEEQHGKHPGMEVLAGDPDAAKYMQAKQGLRAITAGYDAAKQLKKLSERPTDAAVWKVLTDTETIAEPFEEMKAQSLIPLLEFAGEYGTRVKADYDLETVWEEAIAGGANAKELQAYYGQLPTQNEREIKQLKYSISQLDGKIDDGTIRNMERNIESMERMNKSLYYHNLWNEGDYFEKYSAFAEGAKAEDFNDFKAFFGKEDTDAITYAIFHPEATIENNDRAIYLTYFMKETERNNYAYLAATQGLDAAHAYVDFLTDPEHGVLQQRQNLTFAETMKNVGNDYPVLGAALGVAVSPIKAAGAVYSMVAGFRGDDINPYSQYFVGDTAASNLYAGAKERIAADLGEGTVGNFLAQLAFDGVTMSAESMLRYGMMGGFGAAAGTGAAAVAKGASLSLAALGAMSGSVQDATLRGADTTQALLYGGIVGAAEAATEYLPLGALENAMKGGAKGVKALCKSLLSNVITEVPGEVLSEIIGTVADELVMKELSARELSIQADIENGMSPEAAKDKANKQLMKNLLYTALVSSVSAGGSAVTGHVAGKYGPVAKANMDEAAKAAAAFLNATKTQDKASQAATLAAELSRGDGGTAAKDVAAAAAQTLTSALGADGKLKRASATMTLKALSDVITSAAKKGVDVTELKQAIAASALLPDTPAGRALTDIIENGGTADKAEKLITFARDAALKNAKAIETAAEENRIALAVVLEAAGGVFDGAAAAREQAKQAKAAAQEAQKALTDAKAKRRAAGDALIRANAALNENPSDAQAITLVKAALAGIKRADATLKAAAGTLNNAKENYAAANKAAEKAVSGALTAAREQAIAKVRAAKEQAATQAEADAAQAEVRRTEDNGRALDADAFIEENYQDAPENVKDEIRARFMQAATEPMSVAADKARQSDPQNAARIQFAYKLARKFNVDIRFVEGLGALGKHAGNVIKIDKAASMTDMIYEVALHELTHHAETSEGYGEFAGALIDLYYGEDKARLQADIRAKLSEYKAKLPEGRETFDEGDAQREIVAGLTRRVLYGDQQAIDTLAREKPNIAVRFLEWIRATLAKLKGVNDPAADRISQVRGMFERALHDAQGNQATGEGATRFSLKPVEPVKPTSGRWEPTIDTNEAKTRFPKLWDIAADSAEERNPTQIRSTVNTYRKIYELLKNSGFSGNILDASSGLGEGTRAGRNEYGFNVEDIEPFPSQNYQPMYRDYSALDKQYDVIISNAVLNVLPQDQRDALVVKMGEMLAPGGKMYISTRGKDVNQLAKNPNNVKIGDMEWYVALTGSYQKGFSTNELKAYLEDALGAGFGVYPSSEFGDTSVIVINESNGTDEEFTVEKGRNKAADVAEYTEDEYNQFGWARANGVLSAAENRRFNNSPRKAENRTRDGLYLYDVTDNDDVANIIVVSDGKFGEYSINRVYRILFDNDTDAEIVREDIHDTERRKPSSEALQAIKDDYGDEFIVAHILEDTPTYWEFRAAGGAREAGSGSGTAAGGAESGHDGGRSGEDPGQAGTGRPSYSLPSDDILTEQIARWRAARAGTGAQTNAQAGAGSAQPGAGQKTRQFAGKTAQENDAIPEYVKEYLRSNPEELYYDTDTNRAQMNRAWLRIQEQGEQAARERILALDDLNADDIMESILLMYLANQGDGNMGAWLGLASQYNRAGTDAARALQSRQTLAKMGPGYATLKLAGEIENALAEYMNTHTARKEKLDAAAKAVEAELLKLPAPEEDKTTRPSRWGVALNDRQRALIDQYKLNDVGRPGLYYNRATLKQRMLEAILASPDPTRDAGNGLTLVQRLEYMKDGLAVVTGADVDYIGTQLALFTGYGGEFGGRDAEMAISRAYEAGGNITPATKREKFNTWRYTAMLLNLPSAERNIIGNLSQGVPNALAHWIAAGLDKSQAKKTGERTITTLTMAEKAKAWRAFAEETKNTFRDYFIDKTITQTVGRKFDMSQRGRVYQNPVIEFMRNAEGFLMTVGDRNFWKKAYVNSIAEQNRLNDRYGMNRTQEEILARAEADANFAVFNEDSEVRDMLAMIKSKPYVGDIIGFILPFTGVPTNIAKRMVQFSPVGLVYTAVRRGINNQSGKNFDQKAYVEGIARGLTGTAVFSMGILMALTGMIVPGTGNEEDPKARGVEAAKGKQWGYSIKNLFTGEYVSLNVFTPALTPLLMGAAACYAFQGDATATQALVNAGLAAMDTFTDASYLSNVAALTRGNEGFVEKVTGELATAVTSQTIPSLLSELATAIDPFVRDTSDKNIFMKALNTAASKIPFVRETLPEKVDVTGRSVASKEGIRNFIDPLTTTKAADDPMLDELMRLAEALGDTGFLPSDALSGTKTTLPNVDTPIKGKDKEAYKKRYGELWTTGGATYRKNGANAKITGVRDLLLSDEYARMSDTEKAEAIGEITAAAKAGATFEIGLMAGATMETSISRLEPIFTADAGETYMKAAESVWRETGVDSVLPQPQRTFSDKKVEHEVAEGLWSEYVETYRKAYKRYVDGHMKRWDKLTVEKQTEILKDARAAANEAAKKWYIRRAK